MLSIEYHTVDYDEDYWKLFTVRNAIHQIPSNSIGVHRVPLNTKFTYI